MLKCETCSRFDRAGFQTKLRDSAWATAHGFLREERHIGAANGLCQLGRARRRALAWVMPAWFSETELVRSPGDSCPWWLPSNPAELLRPGVAAALARARLDPHSALVSRLAQAEERAQVLGAATWGLAATIHSLSRPPIMGEREGDDEKKARIRLDEALNDAGATLPIVWPGRLLLGHLEEHKARQQLAIYDGDKEYRKGYRDGVRVLEDKVANALDDLDRLAEIYPQIAEQRSAWK